MVESAASSSETVVSRTLMCVNAVALNVYKQASKWSLKWSVPSRAIAESSKPCSTYTNQFINLTGRHSA